MAPADVPYSRYTHLDYFVFTTTPDPAVISQAGISDSQIVDFVTRAKAAGITTSYTYFSTHVSTAVGRTTFARTLLVVMQQYGFDGIDIDWEYPGQSGLNNLYSPNDASNFLLFLQTLRSLAGPDVRLSMAASVAGIMGPTGAYLTDLSGFAAVLDYVTIMTYDITGTWSGFTGPNAPLASACSPGGNQFSIIGAMTAYRNAGFAPSHILVGIPAYSYSYYVSAPLTVTTCPDGSRTTLYQYASSGSTCGTYIGNNGQYLYSQLWDSGYFGNFAGYRRSIDLVSRTWILWNRATGEFIPTEARGTLWYKARTVRGARFGGINVFDASGDTADNRFNAALRIGLGLDAGSVSSLALRRRATLHAKLVERRGGDGISSLAL
ncbi:hypothetical protein Rhopal_005064-T1 [Rhodotorula paludigena]|uniref:GH18 domain-containing protein n=1 Tax=Rhodotorula paludigena TaxID=86838 RepID=A0AAV5GRB6_9BASI|nr:hypothetical protein Rhopal_005064-T1 [Rhodotorula paludigena]